MNVNILDCTLRDGGYINNWRFSEVSISGILFGLTNAGIDIVECGFLKDCIYDFEKSLFQTPAQIISYLPSDRRNTKYVAMVNCGDYDVEQIPPFESSGIWGIRIAFHGNQVDEALVACKKINAKGYNVFMQPMGTNAYSDKELLSLVEKTNDINPYSFYFVDSLGIMNHNDIVRIALLLHYNLNSSIALGFHCHNNLQLAFSNTQKLIEMHLKRELIIDASICGMGRGAGNLSTELIANYLNEVKDKTYNIDRILRTYDEYISIIKDEYIWGYSIPYYLAALHACHPNYATYLLNNATLPVTDVGMILTQIPNQNKQIYSESLINDLYFIYQTTKIDDSHVYNEIKARISKRIILLLAPGKTLHTYEIEINEFIKKNNPVVISINHESELFSVDYTFYSNRKRYEERCKVQKTDRKKQKYLLTSNIKYHSGEAFIFDYSTLCNNKGRFFDNAVVMLLELLRRAECKKTYCAGLDGYASISGDNYYDPSLQNIHNEDVMNEINVSVKNAVMNFRGVIDIEFITPSLYD